MNEIEQIRKEKGVSRYRLAKLTGLDYTTIMKIERNGEARLSSLRKIAKALGVTIQEVVW